MKQTDPVMPRGMEERDSDIPRVGIFDFITNVPGDWLAAGKRIFRSENVPAFLLVAGTTGVGVKYDYETWHPLSVYYHQHKNSTFATFMDVGAQLGVGSSQIFLGVGLVGTGLIAKNNKAIRTGSQIFEAVIATGLTTQFLKHITGRESPSVAIEPRTGKWQWFTNPIKYHHRVSAHDAFPSGHVATATATATVVMENYREQTWIPYIAYPTIFLIGVGMVATDGHWWSDYPLSVFLGYHYGKAITRNNHPNKEDPKKLELNVWTPSLGGLGLMLSKRF